MADFTLTVYVVKLLSRLLGHQNRVKLENKMQSIGHVFGALLLKDLKANSHCFLPYSSHYSAGLNNYKEENVPWVEFFNNFSVNGGLLSILSHRT